MPSLAESAGKELKTILVFVGAIWSVYLLSWIAPVTSWGLQPRSLAGLIGIASMPFLHANLGHIVANTIPLIILLFLLAGSRAKSWAIVVEIVDREEKIESFLPIVDDAIVEGLATVERVDVRFYRARDATGVAKP